MREWLLAYYQTSPEIRLIYYRQKTGQPCLAYNDAVEEALCFGWIDSIVKTVAAERLTQRFCPRKAMVSYSQPNKERLRRLIARGLVMPQVQASLGNLLEEPFVMPEDILQVLQANMPVLGG